MVVFFSSFAIDKKMFKQLDVIERASESVDNESAWKHSFVQSKITTTDFSAYVACISVGCTGNINLHYHSHQDIFILINRSFFLIITFVLFLI